MYRVSDNAKIEHVSCKSIPIETDQEEHTHSRLVSTDSFQTPARRSNSLHNTKQVLPKPKELLNSQYVDGAH